MGKIYRELTPPLGGWVGGGLFCRYKLGAKTFFVGQSKWAGTIFAGRNRKLGIFFTIFNGKSSK